MQPVMAKLMKPEQAAKLFEQTRPRMAVYSHLVKKDLPGAEGDAEILRRTCAAGYLGSLTMGEDHEVIVLGKTVSVEKVTPPVRDLDGPDAQF